MTTLLTILHVIVSLFLVLTVLLQSGKGGGMGAAFGGGNAATVFGGSGASSFLRRLTAGAATVFMLASMVLAYIASHNSGDALEKFGQQQQDLAKQKEAAKSGVNTGSGSAGSAMGSPSTTMGAPHTPSETPDLPSGSATTPPPPVTAPSGSAATPSGSVTPAKIQDKPVTPPVQDKPVTPAKIQDKPVAPSGSATAPAK